MDMSAATLQKSALSGFRRLRDFRSARLMFINAYCGQYYNKNYGTLGREPLNMAFTAVRALVPNIVTRNPKAVISSDYLMYRQYGELLGMGVDYTAKKQNLAKTLQRGLVDAIFTMGIFKTSLVATDSLVYFGDEGVDPGAIDIDTVDFDNFTFDPLTRRLERAGFLGEKIRVERDMILASGLYDNGIIERLPSSLDVELDRQKNVRNLSDNQMNRRLMDKLHDYVDLLELWLPGPNVLVTLPYKSSCHNKFLREEDYYGPDDGPYTFLTLTPPVPDNPINVPLAGVWHDLHIIGNRIAKKAMDQAEAQKDILGYTSTSADAAQELVDAKNLDAVQMNDPQGAQVYSFSGQNNKNIEMTAQIAQWFDQFSGNTSMLAGTQVQTNVATVANIMNQNAMTGVTYMKNEAYEATKSIMRKIAWYLHTDPIIQLPLVERRSVPAEYNVTATEIKMIRPARVEEAQVFLTPEVREGDFLDFAFDIEPDSMAPVNWQLRNQQLEILAVKILPAATNAAMISAQVGTPFSLQRFLTRWAKANNIDWLDEIFEMPELSAMMAAVAKQGPQPQKGIASAAGTAQNKGAVTAKTSPAPKTQERQQAQTGANQSQAALPVREP
ncbi:hypothetical protein KAR91_62850 [Candidatus Pacearchaeota archaeon]|nr:hypothetical protein [Candidatus Pacearchaeota archaeon]